MVELRYKTKDHPRLWAVVTIQPCLDCIPMELDEVESQDRGAEGHARRAQRRSPTSPSRSARPTLHGQPIIYTYQVGTGTHEDVGGAAFGFTNNLQRVLQRRDQPDRVVGAYKDDPATKDELIQKAPKEDLMNLAVSFLDAFTHQW